MPFKDRTQFINRLCKTNLVSNSYCNNVKTTDQNFNRCNNLAPNYNLILELQKYVPCVWFSFASSIAWRVAIKPQLSQNARIILSQVRQLFYNSSDLWCVQNMSPNTTKRKKSLEILFWFTVKQNNVNSQSTYGPWPLKT